jgi:hypothetical protein
MAQPTWITPAGSIGNYPYGFSMLFVLNANSVIPATSVAYTLLAGSLPINIILNSITGVLSGIPSLVTQTTNFTFTVRATDNLGNIRDRTFVMTVTGTAIPQFTTPAGTILSTQDSIWTQLQLEYSNPNVSNAVVVELQQGALPPGLELSPTGLIQGYPQPPITSITLPLVTAVGLTTDSTTDYIYCISVNGITAGRPVTFTDPIGNIVGGVTYYVKVVDQTLNAFSITATQNGGTLPLSDDSGAMSISLPSVQVGQPTARTYNFILRLASPLGGNFASYSITVINQNLSSSQGGPGNGINTRIPTILNTRPLNIIVSDTDPYYGYYILPPVSPSVNAYMGTYLSDNYFAFKIIGHDFDGNLLTYVYSNLPSWLSGDVNTGWITGNPYLGSPGINSYRFTVSVRKTNNTSITTPNFNFEFILSLDLTNNIAWLTPSNLGTIYNSTLSTLKVAALADVDLLYRITSGNLPPNLALLSNGEITGVVASQPTDILLTTGESTNFSVTIQAYSPDYPIISLTKTFNISVYQEYNQPTDVLYIQAAPNINDREILQTLLTNETLIPTNLLYRPNDVYFGKATSVIYAHAYGIYASDLEEYIAAVTINHYWRNITLGELKTAVAKDAAGNIIYEVVYSEVIDNLINPAGQSVPSSIYWPRPIDLNLGPWYTSVTDIFTSYYFGQPGNTLSVTATAASTNQITCGSTVGLLSGRQIMFSGTTFGNIVAGTTYYVLSVDSTTKFTVSTTPYNGTAVVLTTNTGSMNCVIYEPTFYASLTPGFARILYPNSLSNMRNQVANVLGQVFNSTLLPQWMTSQQANGSTLGYTQAWVICYTKLGEAETIKTNIETNWPYTLNQINFNIDRFTVDKSITYDWENKLNPPAWSGLPSATPTPDPLNSQDFYVLFPHQTILPDQTQY